MQAGGRTGGALRGDRSVEPAHWLSLRGGFACEGLSVGQAESPGHRALVKYLYDTIDRRELIGFQSVPKSGRFSTCGSPRVIPLASSEKRS